MYYTHVSGLTYTVYLAVYGDCSGSAFATLSGSAPVVDIYNGGTYVSAMSLEIQAPTSGVEVTPVCRADAGNTTCTDPSNPLPGIKKFIYSGNITLSGTSSAWRFIFGSGMGGSATAGRSGSITNITFGGAGSPIELIDTLNNASSANSSAEYTSIPTPFFCISTASTYNPGAVDPDGDSLTFDLVPGMDASTGSPVRYVYPYTATEPLGVTTGSLTFNNSTGQLSFTPNIVQRALVVYNVREIRGGVLKGTSQREMTMVVLSPCTNTAPTGAISAASAGNIVSSTQLSICNSIDTFQFSIDPTDAEHDSITMSATGLPAGSSFNITGNGSLSPHGTFVWEAAPTTTGTYTFYVTFQDNGCPLVGRQTIAYSITILPAPTESVNIVSQPTCTRNGVFQVTPSGTFSPWTVSELRGTTTLHTFSRVTAMITDSLYPGTYIIRTYNPDFCYRDTTITLLNPVLPSGNITATAPSCPGGTNGSISVTGTRGVTPYQYAIGSGSFGSSGSFSGLAPGSYTIHIKDANSCIKDTVVTVPTALPTLLTFAITRPSCDTFSNGRVIINAYASYAPYTFAVGSGTYGSSDTFGHLPAGTYNFHIKNSHGCITDTTLSITDSASIRARISVTPILCNGGNATVTLTGIAGYGPPYSYAYNTGTPGSTNIFSLPAGSYTFHIADTVGCHLDTLMRLVQPTPISIHAAVTNIDCYGAADGKAILTATGGTPGYRYTADSSTYITSDTLTMLSAGSHVLYVKDTNGCIYSDTVNVAQPTRLVFDSIVLREPSCHGGSNGIISVYGSGGIPPYQYALTTGAFGSSSVFIGLSAGTYTIHFRDTKSCIKDSTFTLGQPSIIVPTATITQSSCATLANGTVTLGATGGTPGYSFAQGSGTYGTTPTFTGLSAGTYVFHIKDTNSCVADTSITISNLFHISGIFGFTEPACHGGADGAISVSGSGGTAPYAYSRGSAAFSDTSTFSGLAAGSYTIQVKDSSGCIGDTSVTLAEPALLLPTLTLIEPSCHGLSDGSILVNGTGGIRPYTFSLNGSSFVSTAAYPSLPAARDTIVIKDAHGCRYDTIVTLLQPSPVAFGNIAITNISCNGSNDGKATITAIGGTPMYQYAANSAAWQMGNIVTGLVYGTNMLHLEDSHGCATDSAVNITQPAPLGFSGAAVTNPTCEGFKDGSVLLYPAGGTTPYQYSTNNITYSPLVYFTSLPEGTDTFYITDANHCKADTVITLVGYPHILIDSIILNNLFCNGSNNGNMTVDASGGIHPLSYTLSGNPAHTATNTFSGINFGTYTVTVTDSKGCVKDSTFSLNEPDSLLLNTTVIPNDCTGPEDNGSITVIPSGGTPPYSYFWNVDSANLPVITGMPNGDYSVVVKDIHGCADSTTIKIGFNDCCTPFIPKAFTPNGDGRNDEFRIKYRGDIRIIEFAIYNRFGEKVFLAEYTERGWDGSYKGAQAEVGTYYYYIRLICGNLHDKVLEFKGDVTLIR